ncbi:MAG: UDP-3-O-(3-hydroxymyristoyl)glucosamine N-acyltransferase [Verrucomicrobia bacterium]|nr:UDP-3-O-(3-hydroxymyristoyl)glucosamine N-acyltransferase [Verrucomicrobiota bacterium]
MHTTVEEVAALVGGRFTGDVGNTRITGVASVGDAQKGDITFFGNPKYLPILRTSRASCALVPEGFDEPITAIPIQVANPSLAFSRVVEQFAPAPVLFEPGIHPSAVVAASARIGEGVSIQAHAVVEAGAVIGDHCIIGANAYVGHEAQMGADCHLYPNATIRERCTLGQRVIIHSGAVIGSDGFGYETVQGRYTKIPQTGTVKIDDDVEIGANTTIDRARFGRTWIGEGTKIDNLVQIGHNVVIGKHCILCSQVGISGSSKIGDHVTLAGQAGLVGHIEVGDHAIVAAQSGVSKDIPAKEIWFGSPAAPMRDQKIILAHQSRLPKLHERVKRLEEKLAGEKAE